MTSAAGSAGPGSGPVRVGVVGCGGMGAWHADNVARQPGLIVVAAGDVVPEAARAVARKHQARVQDSDALVVAEDVDAVVIASSDDSHARYAVAVVAAGKPCLLEKPLGSTLDQADQILAAELAAGRRLIRVGFMREFDPAHLQVAAQLAELGPVTRVRSVHRNIDPAHRPIEMLFSQSLIHDIHTIRWFSGEEVTSVRAHIVNRPDGFRDVLMVCRLTSGALGTIDFEDQAFAYEVHAEVTALNGMAATLPHPRAVHRHGGNESLLVGADWFSRFEDAYRLEIEAWAADLRAGAPMSGPSVWDGYAAQVVVDAALTAITEDREVSVEVPAAPDLYRP